MERKTEGDVVMKTFGKGSEWRYVIQQNMRETGVRYKKKK